MDFRYGEKDLLSQKVVLVYKSESLVKFFSIQNKLYQYVDTVKAIVL